MDRRKSRPSAANTMRVPSGDKATDCRFTVNCCPCGSVTANRVTGTCRRWLRASRASRPQWPAPTSTPAATSIARRQRRRRRRPDRRSLRDGMRLAEHEERGGDVADALFLILAQAALNQRADSSRHIRGQRVPVRLALEHRGERVGHVLSGEGAPAGQHLVEHASEGPDVAALVRRPALRLLGRHVGRRAEHHPRLSSSRAS